jgi:hypothetical protein
MHADVDNPMTKKRATPLKSDERQEREEKTTSRRRVLLQFQDSHTTTTIARKEGQHLPLLLVALLHCLH